jgi:hypothetical protein
MMQNDPIQYPTVSIDGTPVEVKFRCGDIIRLKKAGVDIGDLSPVKGVEAMERTLTFLQHGIAHQMKKTVDELADSVDLANLPAIGEAINEALKKASPQAPASTTVQ